MNTSRPSADIFWHDKPLKNKSDVDSIALAKYVNIGYYLIAPLLIGVFFGLGIDKIFGTDSLFTIIFLVIGTIATFYNLYSLVKKTY